MGTRELATVEDVRRMDAALDRMRRACGCEPGFRLCPQAEALWDAVTLAYHNGGYPNDGARYDAARAAYEGHTRAPNAA